MRRVHMKTDRDVSYCGSTLGRRYWPDEKPSNVEWCPYCEQVRTGVERPGFRAGVEEDLGVYLDDDDPRKAMSVEEVRELLTVCLHGPLPQNTIYRMMATLAVWMDLPEQLDKAKAVLSMERRPDDTSQLYTLEKEVLRLLRQLEHFRCGEAIPDKTWEQELDLALERLEHTRDCLREAVGLMDALRNGEYTPDSFTTQPWREALENELPEESERDKGAQNACNVITASKCAAAFQVLRAELEEARGELSTVNTAFDRVAEAHGKLENRLQQALEAADGCRFRSADAGQYECPAFPCDNQARNGKAEG